MDARHGAQRRVVPFASFATPQICFPEKTHWEVGDSGALLCSSGVTCYADAPALKLRFRKPLEVACNSARLASRLASQIGPVTNANLV